MPVTRSASSCQSPYSLLVPQLTKIKNRLKKAETPEEHEVIMKELRDNTKLFKAFLKEKKAKLPKGGKSSDAPIYVDLFIPKFSRTHQRKLRKIYFCLMGKDSEKKEDALDELKESPAALAEFLLKTLPSPGLFPEIESIAHMESMLIPLACVMFKEDLTRIYDAIRDAKTQDERKEVLQEVVDKTHLMREFLKRNVPQFNNL